MSISAVDAAKLTARKSSAVKILDMLSLSWKLSYTNRILLMRVHILSRMNIAGIKKNLNSTLNRVFLDFFNTLYREGISQCNLLSLLLLLLLLTHKNVWHSLSTHSCCCNLTCRSTVCLYL